MTALTLAKMKKALAHEDFLHVHEVLSQLTSDLGWTRAWRTLQDAIAGTVGTGWYSINLTILSIFKMEELIGYDGDVPEVLASLQNTHDFGEVERAFLEAMTDRVREQLTSHGSTLLYDTQKMETRRTASLIPDIASARRFEFARVVKDLVDLEVFSYPGGFEQKPLLLTAYGRRLVEETGVTEFKYLVPHLQELGREIGVDVPEFIPLGDSKPYVIGAKTPGRPKLWKPEVSERLARVVLMFTDIMDPPSIDDVYTLFESGFASSADVVTLVIEDRQDAWTHGFGHISDYGERSIDKIYLAAVEHLASLPSSQHRTTLLSKVLVKKLSYHFERRDHASMVHLAALRGLRKDKGEQATNAVLDFVNIQEWEPYGEGCQDRQAVLLLTTPEVLDQSLGFVIERGQNIKQVLIPFIRCLNWSSKGGIGEVISRRIVETEGPDAVDTLVAHIMWERMGCGSGVNNNVFAALATLGPVILRRLKDYLWDKESINRTVVSLMEHIRPSSDPLVEFIVENSRGMGSSDVKWLLKTVRHDRIRVELGKNNP